jgi:hypothetical protein
MSIIKRHLRRKGNFYFVSPARGFHLHFCSHRANDDRIEQEKQFCGNKLHRLSKAKLEATQLGDVIIRAREIPKQVCSLEACVGNKQK